jgi:adenine-specific DNA-methyltransferase
MERLLQICAPEKDALILDPFAGSGTTAHAVLKMNQADGGNRRFIMASNRESTDESPDKNLCKDVCAKRISNVIRGYQSGKTGAVEAIPGDFAYLRATRVPIHRLDEGLTDPMVWNFGLLACDHKLSPGAWPVATSVRESDNHMVIYCTNTKAATLRRLCEVVQVHQGKVAVLSWAPKVIEDALGDLAARVSMVNVPTDFVLAFKQGNARATVTEEAPE